MATSDYVTSYEDLTVHQLMLEDSARNEAYKKAIFDNKCSFADKVVLDIGAGTGILSIYSAKAGARKVYAVELSNTYQITEEIVKENGFEKIIEVIHGSIEEVDLPEKVDIIVSEWMGHYLLHEGMLGSIIVARDKFLKPSGMLFPESATIYCAPCSVPSMFDYWENISGVSMKSFGRRLRSKFSDKPEVMTVQPDHIIAKPEIISWLDLREITKEDIAQISFEHVSVATQAARYQGICIWFSCAFPSSDTEPVVLSTAPEDPATHWKQTVLILPSELLIEKSAPMAYKLLITRSLEYPRTYDIELSMLDPDKALHPEDCSCYYTKCILTRAILETYNTRTIVD